MQPDPKNSSGWLISLHKELLRGKHLLLHGNVADLFLLNGEYTTLRDFLNRYFPEEGFQLVAHYDIVDGLQLADSGRMRPIFQQIRGGNLPPAASAPANTTPTSQSAPAASRRVVPPVDSPAVGEVGGSVGSGGVDASLLRPDVALPVIRTLLAQRRVPTAVSLAFSDKLVGDAQHQSGEEPRWLVLLKKMIQEAALIDSGPMRNRRNALVIVAEQLSGVPAWIYQNNPLLKLIHVTRPEREERVHFYNTFVGNFFGGGELTREAREKGVQEFADLTDGLTAHELHSMRRTSLLESRSIAKPRELVSFYKFGDQEDPWTRLDSGRIRSAEPTLNERVIGQDTAVKAVVDMLVTARVGLSLGDGGKAVRPKGVFFFVGPTGVGKTELAKALTSLLFSNDTAFARFDMSEYAMEHAAEKLTGSPPGYVGYDEGGQLTGRVLDKPFSLLLFDEIEKAHGKIMDKFLQILEDGRLTDSKGQTADFSQSVIIFTSNIGSDTLEYTASARGELPGYQEVVKPHYLREVQHHFTRKLGRPELLNRFGDNILVFDLLRPKFIRGIARKFLGTLERTARERHQLTLNISDDVSIMIEELMRADPNNLRMGGRRVRTLIEEKVLKVITRHVFDFSVPAGTTLEVVSAPDRQRILVR
jgi:energy-coupling factor transporter ATP-binding protein EcfA2